MLGERVLGFLLYAGANLEVTSGAEDEESSLETSLSSQKSNTKLYSD